MSLLLGPLGGKRSFNPRQELFSNNEQGLWLDPSDMTAGKAAWRRNLLGWTEDYSNSYWTKASATTATEVVANPINGTVTRLESTTTAAVGIGLERNIASALDTFSIYVKKGNARYIGLTTQASATNTVFDLDTGTVASQAAFHSTATITDAGDGWFRISVTADNSSSNSVVRVRFFTGPTTIGAVTGDYTYVTGAQLEERSTASTYQKLTDFSTEFKAAFPTHTLYQDSNGVTPCTAAGDPVGLILDQSRGGLSQIGAELVTNGDFGSATGWTTGGVWTISGGTASISASTTTLVQFGTTATAGKWYQVTYTITSLTGGSIRIEFGGANGITRNAAGTYTQLMLATNTNPLVMQPVTSLTATIDNVSIKEVPGNHAYQTTSGSRPLLARTPDGGRRNVLTFSEQFDNAAWVKLGSSVSANQAANPINGLTDADIFTEDSSLSNHGATQTYTATAAAHTFSVYAKYGSHSHLELSLDQSGGDNYATFDIQNGTVGVQGTGATTNVTSLGNGWFRFAVTFTMTAGSKTARIRLGTSSTTFYYTGNGTRTTTLWGAQLEVGSSVTTLQKVGLTSDVTESGKRDCWGLLFDGSDDFLQTASIDFSATDEMTVIAGVRKLSDAASGVLAELGTTSAAGSFSFFTPNVISPNGDYYFRSRGTGSSNASFAKSAPTTDVVSGIGDISGDISTLRINGAVAATSATDQGTGNYTNNPIYVGARGGSSSRLSGILYTLIIRGATTPTGKLLEAERFTAKKTGLSI